jgi:ferric enterobactin receptor
MYHRHSIKGKLIRITIILIIIIFTGKTGFAQYKEFTFNTPGNDCYFKYLCFAPDSNYNSIKRPFIFIMGRENESAVELFQRDTLKYSPGLYNYEFVYVPNMGQNSRDKLQCIPALTSLITFSYKYGHTNLFFRVDDKMIKPADMKTLWLSTVFKTIRLSYQDSVSNALMAENSNILNDFKETAVVYDPVVKEETGTFYVENSGNEDAAEEAEVKPQKTYFGPPMALNYTLTGAIKDKTTGEALPFANIQVKGTTIGTSSNNDGYFTLVKVPADTNTLIIQYVGYEKTEVFLNPQIQKKNFIIEIKPNTQSLQGIIVTAHRDDVSISAKEDISTIKLTPKKLEQLPGIGERDIMRSLQLMPGVSASNESSSGLYVRGGTPDQNLVLYDGFTVYHVDHLYGFFSAFNSNALKDVQLYKGGFESKFGGRLSSVTEITSKEGNQKRFNIGGDVSLLSANIFIEAPIGSKFTSFIAFRKSYQGSIYNKIFEKFNKGSEIQAVLPDGGGPGRRFSQDAVITSFFYDLNGKFTYHPGDKDVISLSFYNGADKLDNGFTAGTSSFGQFNSNFNMNSTDLTKYGNIGSSLKWSRKWNDKIYGNTILCYSNYFSNRERSQERTIFNASQEAVTNKNGVFENNNLKDFSLKSDYQWDLLNFSQLQFGAFATYYNINYTYAQNDTSAILDRKDKGLLAGGYFQSELKLLNDKVHFTPGVRVSHYGITDKLYLEPRSSVSVSITKQISFTGAIGKYFQFANRVTREDILSGNKDFWILSDGDFVPVSSSVHFIGGLSYESDDYIFSAEAYYKKISNLTEHSLRINANPTGVNYNENFFSGYGYSTGIEFLVQKKYGNLNGWLSYTLGEARNHFSQYSDSYYPANQDVKHEIKIVGLYKMKRWDFSANWIYASGRPYTAPSGAYSITLLDGSEQDFFTVTSKNSLRLPDYHRLDIAATYKLLAGNKGQKRRREIGYVGISIFNVYNHRNNWYKQFTIEEGQIIETNINYLGFTPNLTLSLKLR